MSNPTELPGLAEVLSNDELIEIGQRVRGIEASDGGGYFLPITFGREVERAVLARRAQPEGEAPQADALWHAPGMGEVHYHDHSLMIDCRREIDDPEQDYIADDDLAKRVCVALNSAQHAESGALPPLPEDGPCSDCQHGMLYTGRQMQKYARAAIAAQSQGAQEPVPREFSTAIEDLHTVVNVIAERLDGDGRTAMARRLQNAAVDVDLASRAALAAKAEAPVADELVRALRQAERLLRAAGFAMTGTASSQIVAAIAAHSAAGQQAAAPGALESIAHKTRPGQELDINSAIDLISEVHIDAKRAACSAHGTPEAQADLKQRMADALNVTLWLYRRLPGAYGRPPFVDAALLEMARIVDIDAPAAIKERAAQLDGGQGEGAGHVD